MMHILLRDLKGFSGANLLLVLGANLQLRCSNKTPEKKLPPPLLALKKEFSPRHQSLRPKDPVSFSMTVTHRLIERMEKERVPGTAAVFLWRRGGTCEQNEHKKPWLFVVFLRDEVLPGYVGIFHKPNCKVLKIYLGVFFSSCTSTLEITGQFLLDLFYY